MKKFRRDMPQLSGSYQYGYDALPRLTEVTKRPLAMYNVYSSRIGYATVGV